MTTFLVLILLGYVVYLDRKLWRLQLLVERVEEERWTAPATVAEPHPAPEPEPQPLPEVSRAEPASERVTAPLVDEVPKPLVAEAPADDALPSRWQLPAISFEELFGRRLPIWGGGVTLAVAGFLIVRYSIEAGLFSPALRVAGGLIFGLALIGGAEWARRRADFVRDPRVAQALSGAGIASLYGSVLVAVNLYALIGAATAMVGMAAVTALALALALRFGSPSALLGLAGGLAAPAMIGSAEPNVPLLMLYLALAVGGLTAVSRRQRWAWLGIGALVGGFGWGLILLIGGALDAPSAIALTLYLLLLGLLLPGLAMAGDLAARIRLVAGAVAAVQIAALVATGGFTPLHWGLFGLLAAALQWLQVREPDLAPLPPLGLAVGLLLVAAWPEPGAAELALVLGGGALVFGGPALWRLWRPGGGLIEAGQLAGMALGGLLLPLFHLYPEDGSRDVAFGLLALALGLAAGAMAGLGWRHAERGEDARFALLATASAVLLSGAAVLLLPVWAEAIGVGLVAVGLLELRRASTDGRLEWVAWGFVAASVMLMFGGSEGAEFGRAIGDRSPVFAIGALRWLALAGVAALFAWRSGVRGLARLAQGSVALFAHLGLAQLIGGEWLAMVPPALAIAGAAAGAQLGRPLAPFGMTALTLVLLWALVPLEQWHGGGISSLMGIPMLLPDVPTAREALLRLAIPAAALAGALALLRGLAGRRQWQALAASAAVLGLVGLHSLYKQLFAIAEWERFVALGMAERLVWTGVLLGLAAAAWRWRAQVPQRTALALLGLATAHHLVFTLLLFNPLGAEQAVGPWPLMNLLLPAYAGPILLLWLGERRGLLPERSLPLAHGAQMLLLTLFAVSTLRQLFHGSLLVGGGLGPAEDIARSIVAIALAIGFLLWGIRTGQRSWRIGSLILMLAAVAKVFLMDASGLEGLTRIASFVALGLSLIGIGWLYARQLGGGGRAAAAAA